MARQLSSPGTWLPLLAWLLVLALLPWWLGLPSLLALAAALALMQQRLLPRHQWLLRRSLGWGLPGMLLALQRGLHAGVLGWVAALLGALAGYTLLAGLDAWLNRHQAHAPLPPPGGQWPAAEHGPAVEIIELELPQWQALAQGASGDPGWHEGKCRFADGACIGRVAPVVGFSPDRQWFVAQLEDPEQGVLLWQRTSRQQHRLPGWQLSGWYRNAPWLVRHEGDMPLALAAVLEHDVD